MSGVADFAPPIGARERAKASSLYCSAHAAVLALLLASFGIATYAAERQASAKGPPNFVVFLVDDLGWGAMGAYGSRLHETPHFDQLCKRGVRFTNAYSACTVCSPSRAAIFTGQHPARLRLTDWIPGHDHPHEPLQVPDWEMEIDHRLTTLPEALRERGYQTWFLGKWHLTPHRWGRSAANDQARMAEHSPEKHGFDVNLGGREWGHPKGRGGYFAPYDMPGLSEAPAGEYLTDRLTEEAIGLIRRAGEQPFLLFLSHYTVHSPLAAKPKDIDHFLRKVEDASDPSEAQRAVYAAMHKSLDESVGRVCAELDALGLAEDTLVVFTSDNGGDRHDTCGGLRGRKGTPFEGGVRVPLVVVWPGKTPPGSVCHTPVIGTDLYPTLLDVAGAPRAKDKPCDGSSLVSLLREGSPPDRDALYWHYPHYHRTSPYGSVRSGDWKLIEYYEDGRRLLFNLANDPAERQDKSATDPTKAGELGRLLAGWREGVAAQMPTKRTPRPAGSGDPARGH